MLRGVSSVLRTRTVKVLGSRIMSSLEPAEVTFAVPWGHVAGKAWGDPAGKPVLALHGWLDNAGSFDTLIPLLSKELYVVAVDWPGHGKSSHYPVGARHNATDYLADIKYIVDALKWDQFSLLAHSLGGGAASWFAAALPDQVQCAVLLDALGFWTESLEDLPELTGRSLKTLSKLDRPDTKTYPTLDSVLDRILQGHVQLDKDFDRECAQTLAHRGSRQLEDGTYQFTRDLRVKSASVLKLSHEMNETFLNAIKCPTLAIIAEGEDSKIKSRFREVYSRVKNDQITAVKVVGGHHMHLHQPQTVRPLVNQFLLQQTIPPQFEKSKL